MRTQLCDLLGIESPVVLAPMGGAVTPELAAAVSNAGGLGMLPLTWATDEEVADRIAETTLLTRKPFGVNLGLAWDQRRRLANALAAGARIVSFFWGDPSALIPEAHASGATVITTVGSAAEAGQAVESGADVVVAQGWEAGGHVWSTVSTLALVPRVVDAVAPVPVIAAGGIADGRGLAAVIALGAGGAWIGSRFLTAAEAAVHPDYRQRLLAATETDTFYGTLFDVGWPDAPHRVLRNSTVEAWEQAGRPRAGDRPGEGDTPAAAPNGSPIKRYASSTPYEGVTGDTEPLSNWSGQGIGLATRVQPAADIVHEIVDDAERVLQEASRSVTAGYENRSAGPGDTA